jgi:protein-L-isoaspartate O-methyltransferase
VEETPAVYFEELWTASADPWDHAGRWYETRKYDLTTATLPAPRYHHAVEPACGIGLLTTRLAARADRVTATDRFPRAVAEAAARCASLPHVTAAVADVRDGPPAAPYDLAVLG